MAKKWGGGKRRCSLIWKQKQFCAVTRSQNHCAGGSQALPENGAVENAQWLAKHERSHLKQFKQIVNSVTPC